MVKVEFTFSAAILSAAGRGGFVVWVACTNEKEPVAALRLN